MFVSPNELEESRVVSESSSLKAGRIQIGTSLRYVHPVTERRRTAVESVVRTWREGQQDDVRHNPATDEERPAARLALSA